MDLRQLRIFVSVAEWLNFTRAAEALGYAQSNVTTQIRLLEEEFDTRLFERLGRKIALTPDGEKLYYQATQLQKRVEDIQVMMSRSPEPGGVLTVGIAESLCVFRMPTLFKQYCKRYRQVKLVIRLGYAQDFQRWLRDSAVDLVFFIDGQNGGVNDLQSRILCPEPMLIVGEPEHRLRAKGFLEPEDLRKESFIFTSSGCCYRLAMEKIMAAAGVKPVSAYEFDSLESIKQFAAAGLGIALLPQAVVKNELAAGELVDMNWQGPPVEMFTQVSYHRDKWISPALACLLEIVGEHFPEPAIGC